MLKTKLAIIAFIAAGMTGVCGDAKVSDAAGNNLAPAFELPSPGKKSAWSGSAASLQCATLKDGALSLEIPANLDFTIVSKTLVLDQKNPGSLRYGLTFRGETFPFDWRHGLLLDDVVYQDGTKATWNDTHFIFRSSSKIWSRESHVWHPPKPVKSLRLMLLFTSSAPASLQIKDIFLETVGKLENTADNRENFTGGPTNLVPNAGFEIIRDGEPKNWSRFFSVHPVYRAIPTELEYACDHETRRSGNTSLRLSNSGKSLAGMESIIYSVIDFNRTFELSGYVKSEKATGMIFLEAIFYRAWLPMGFSFTSKYGTMFTTNMLEEVGRLRSDSTSGTHDWKRLAVRGKAPEGANLVRFRIHSVNNSGTAWIDDLNFDGFGIDPLELIMSQVGFAANGPKKAFVRSNLAEKSGDFRLLSGQETVFEGKLHFYGLDEWGKNLFTADFGAFSRPGSFRFEATVGKERVISPEFPVSRDFYRNMAEISRDFMFHMRCGCDIPGFHKACHLDDAQIRSKPNLEDGGKVVGHASLQGGWHDAGDYDKYQGSTVLPVITLAQLGARFKDPAFLDEAAWGADFLRRSVADKGGVYYSLERLSPRGNIIVDQTAPEEETDNIPNTADDRVIKGVGHDIIVAMGLVEYALCEPDRGKAAAAVERALVARSDFLNSDKMTAKYFTFGLCSRLIQLEMALHRHTGNKEYLDSARKYLSHLLNAIAENNGKKDWSGVAPNNHHYPRDYILVPLHFALMFPDDPLAPEIKREIKIYIDKTLLPQVESSPLGILDYRGDQAVKWRNSHRTTSNLSASAVFAAASRLYKNPQYLERAENLFHYVTGVNPAGMSLITGYGWKTMATFCAASGIPGRTNGTVIKGGVLKGISRGIGQRKAVGAYLCNGMFNGNVDHPSGYPYAIVAGDFPIWSMEGAQEFWECLNAAFMLAIEEILAAKSETQQVKNESSANL